MKKNKGNNLYQKAKKIIPEAQCCFPKDQNCIHQTYGLHTLLKLKLLFMGSRWKKICRYVFWSGHKRSRLQLCLN